MSQNTDVLIIGGGIIGISTAYYLAKQGMAVTVVEKGDICAGSSYGNAGLLCPCHSAPIPAPGVLTQGLKWLLDPESPFYIKPSLDPALLAWLWKFQAHCNVQAFHKAIPLLRDMQRASLQLYGELIAREKIDCHFKTSGGLSLCLTERGYARAQHEVDEMQNFGLKMALLNREAVQALEPAVHPDVVGGIHYQEDAHLDPALFVNGLAEAAQAKGATLLTQTGVLGFDMAGQQVAAVQTTAGVFQPKQIVLAAGAWSTALARNIGVSFPMQPAKGYSVTMKRPPEGPQMHLHLSEAKMAVTPMGPHLRFAGTLELAGLDQSINQRRVKAILRAGAAYLRHTTSEETVEIWGGLRPCSPDGLPYIGRPRMINNLVIATGHAMLGVSMGPITGKLVSQLISEQHPELDIGTFDIDRFSR